jgi:hypothetical protein
MKKLIKSYGLNSDMSYYEMILESKVNGQTTQSRTQFFAMPKAHRKEFVKMLLFDRGETSQSLQEFFFDLL